MMKPDLLVALSWPAHPGRLDQINRTQIYAERFIIPTVALSDPFVTRCFIYLKSIATNR